MNIYIYIFLSLLLVVQGVEYIHEECDLVIAGGSTAALAAAVSSAQNRVNVCLLEPSDWPGFVI